MNLYEQAKAAGIPTDHHESDLYLPATDRVRDLLAGYEWRASVKTFRSRIDGQLWYDVPFAYAPFWDAKRAS